jgi:hypothetical protein
MEAPKGVIYYAHNFSIDQRMKLSSSRSIKIDRNEIIIKRVENEWAADQYKKEGSKTKGLIKDEVSI